MVESHQAQKLVSIIVPVYNGERFLPECIDSLLAQTYKNIEIICVDDGSTDKSSQLLASYTTKDSRIRLISQKNAGPGPARNRGIEVATGEYITFFDADDWCKPSLVESAVKRIEETQADMVVLAYNVFDQRIGQSFFADWTVLPDKFPREPFCWNDNPDWAFRALQNLPWNKFLRRDFVNENNLHFEEDVFLTEDLMFSAPAIVRAKRIACIASPLIFHREGTGENVMAKKDLHPVDFIQAFRTFKAFLESEGVMNELHVGYVNWALDGIVHNVQTLNTYEGFSIAVRALTEGGALRDLGLDDVNNNDLHEEVFKQFLTWIKAAPSEMLYRQFLSAREGQSELSSRLCVEYRINREKQAYIDDLEHQLAERDKEIAWRRNEMDALRSEFEAQMSAAEQKVGQAICWIPRRIQEALRRGKN